MGNKKQLIIELATARAIKNELENLIDNEDFYNEYEIDIDKAMLEIARNIQEIKLRLKK